MLPHNRRDFLKRTVTGGALATFVLSGTKASGQWHQRLFRLLTYTLKPAVVWHC